MAGQQIEHGIGQQPFGGNVQQIEPLIADRLPDAPLLFRAQRTVPGGRRNPHRVGRVHLVLHQRDQRRDDDGQPLWQRAGNW
jgi:hypothetical protein